jgi:DivIVA domain-containing protein
MTSDRFPGDPDVRRRAMSATIPRDVPDEEIAGVRDVSFPIVMRGYDRAAVDAYVTRVNRIIAELEVSRSPQSAIRHALDQVGEETRGILERAHETAEDITRRSQVQAADRLERAEREARELVAAAEARVRALQADTDAIDRERTHLIEDARLIADELQRVANEAAERVPPEPAQPEADTVAIDPDAVAPGAEAEPDASAEPIDTDEVEPVTEEESSDGAESEPPPRSAAPSLPPPLPPRAEREPDA